MTGCGIHVTRSSQCSDDLSHGSWPTNESEIIIGRFFRKRSIYMYASIHVVFHGKIEGDMFFIVSHRLMAQFRRNGGSVSYNKGLDIPRPGRH